MSSYAAGTGIIQGIMAAAEERNKRKQNILDAIIANPDAAIAAYGPEIDTVSTMDRVQQFSKQREDARQQDLLSRFSPQVVGRMNPAEQFGIENLISGSRGMVAEDVNRYRQGYDLDTAKFGAENPYITANMPVKYDSTKSPLSYAMQQATPQALQDAEDAKKRDRYNTMDMSRKEKYYDLANSLTSYFMQTDPDILKDLPDPNTVDPHQFITLLIKKGGYNYEVDNNGDYTAIWKIRDGKRIDLVNYAPSRLSEGGGGGGFNLFGGEGIQVPKLEFWVPTPDNASKTSITLRPKDAYNVRGDGKLVVSDETKTEFDENIQTISGFLSAEFARDHFMSKTDNMIEYLGAITNLKGIEDRVNSSKEEGVLSLPCFLGNEEFRKDIMKIDSSNAWSGSTEDYVKIGDVNRLKKKYLKWYSVTDAEVRDFVLKDVSIDKHKKESAPSALPPEINVPSQPIKSGSGFRIID